MTLQVVTANRLDDGLVVFLAGGGRWTSRIGDAQLASTEEAAQALQGLAQRAVDANEVVGPYLVDVEHGHDGIRPVRYREWLRTQGPTVRLDLGYQAAALHAGR